jgi:hypothetical protein
LKSDSHFQDGAHKAALVAVQTIKEKAATENEEGAPAPSFADVARKITGDDAPPWLVKTLENWAPCLAIDRGIAISPPDRK